MLQTLKNNPSLLRCPKCHQGFSLQEASLVCDNGHSYDLSKRGSVHLLLHPVRSVYDAALFDARKRTADSGFFTPLTQIITEMISSYVKEDSWIKMVDAGCGEGSLALNICQSLSRRTAYCCGVDISKDGIQLATKTESDILWIVGDLADLPFQDKAFNVVLNVLSPANYGEFQRILGDDGILIKVLPGTGYLKEFREIFYADQVKETYTNNQTKEHFQRRMDVLETQNIHYTITPNEKQLHDLISMTPMLLNKDPNAAQKEALKKIQAVSLDYEILIGRSKLLRE